MGNKEEVTPAKRTVFAVKGGYWIFSDEMSRRGMFVTQKELDSALDVIDSIAEESGRQMHNYDNYNIGMLTAEDRRYRRIARDLEGQGE